MKDNYDNYEENLSMITVKDNYEGYLSMILMKDTCAQN